MILPAKHINILDNQVDNGCFLWNGGVPKNRKIGLLNFKYSLMFLWFNVPVNSFSVITHLHELHLEWTERGIMLKLSEAFYRAETYLLRIFFWQNFVHLITTY